MPNNETNFNTSTTLRIEGVFSSLTVAEQRVAKYVLENQDKVIYHSVTELAEFCDSGEATVIRTCRKLGYSGFQDLKISIAKELVNPLAKIHEEAKVEDSCYEILGKMFNSAIQALDYTKNILDPAELERAGQEILHADKLAIFGLGNSGAIALDAQHKFMRIGISCASYTDTHLQVIAASFLKPGDVALGISHSGSSKDVVEALKIAKEMGATTICITTHGKSPIVKVSDIRLFTSSEEVKYRVLALASRIAQLGIIDSLYTYVALRNNETVIEGIDRLVDALKVKKY